MGEGRTQAIRKYGERMVGRWGRVVFGGRLTKTKGI